MEKQACRVHTGQQLKIEGHWGNSLEDAMFWIAAWN